MEDVGGLDVAREIFSPAARAIFAAVGLGASCYATWLLFVAFEEISRITKAALIFGSYGLGISGLFYLATFA